MHFTNSDSLSEAPVALSPSLEASATDEFGECLRRHDFEGLFVDQLGWDRVTGTVVVDDGDRHFAFDIVAHKRGFQILRCSTGRQTLLNRGLLRRIQRRMTKLIHEHVLIYSCEEPAKQVWQWAIHLADGRRIRHREHPFFSAEPPAPLVDRLTQMRFDLGEEESVTLVDALQRVRNALDTTAELKLFARRPKYAERSDELAKAMQNGDPTAFQKFIVFHRPLARHNSKRLHWWFGMDPDDAEQIAIIGLMEAARRFKPELGYQFSTYATHWVKQACQRYGPDVALMIRVPQHMFWPCFRLRYSHDRLLARYGKHEGRERFDRLLQRELGSNDGWTNFSRAMNVRSLSDRKEQEFRETRRIVDPSDGPLETAIGTDRSETVRAAINRLHRRPAEIIRMRYGIDGFPMTLEEVGEVLDVTRERVRQIQTKAEERLRFLLRDAMRNEFDTSRETESEAEDDSDEAKSWDEST